MSSFNIQKINNNFKINNIGGTFRIIRGIHEDAKDWIARVRANGGNASTSTLNAVSDFCYAINRAGIRDRFYRLNLFCGTDLVACLVPLYRGQSLNGTQYGNTTDTNTNFISSNYTERGSLGGLTSNTTTQFLNTGSAPSSWPAVATGHMSYWRRVGTTTGSWTYIPIGAQSDTAYRMDERSSGQFGFWGSYSGASNAVANAGGHRIVSRTSPTSLTLYSNGFSVGTSSVSASPTTVTVPVRVFDVNNNGASGGNFFLGTLCAYSFGASLTASQAEAFYSAMNTFQNALARGIPKVSNADAQSWINRVYNNGGTVSTSTAAAVNTFCNAIDAAGIRDRFIRLNLFCGDQLAAALVPLYRSTSISEAVIGNATDTNTGPFVSGDYAETGATGGLKGNGSTKYLQTGVLANTVDKSSAHLSCYAVNSETSSAFACALGATTASPSASFGLFFNGSTLNSPAFLTIDNVGPAGPAAAANNPAGHLIGSQSGISEGRFFINGTQSGVTNTNAATVDLPTSLPLFVFRRNNNIFGASYTNARLAAYSIGRGLSVSQAAAYYAAMQAFQTAMGRA